MARGRPKGSKNKLVKKLLKDRQGDKSKENSFGIPEEERIDVKEKMAHGINKDGTVIGTSLTKEQQDKRDKLHNVMRDINVHYKDPTMCKFAKDEPPKESIPFDKKELDEFLGGGGVYGNFVIFWGTEGVGKTTLALMQITGAQKRNKNCVYIDMEHTIDKQRMEVMGVDTESLVLVENCETAEQTMDIVIKLAKEKVADLVIIDSIQAMSPKDEQYEGKANKEKSMEKNNIALLARKMSEFLRRTASAVYKGKMAVILIGQARTGGIGGFAPHDTLSAGRAVKFYSLLTVYARKGQGVDAPFITEKIKKMILNDEGDKEEKLVNVKTHVGFDVVLKIEKTKKTNSKPELSELHLSYYFKSGFIKKE